MRVAMAAGMRKRTTSKLILTTETIKTIAGGRLDRVAGAFPVFTSLCTLAPSCPCPTNPCLTILSTMYTQIDCP
jgi:hypothetical protein